MALNTRQRTLLYFVRKNGKPVRNTELMKWLFLYSQQETKSANRFDFVPYKYGPFSFEATHNLNNSLAQYLSVEDTGISIRRGSEYDVTSIVQKLGVAERTIADSVWIQHHGLSVDELLRKVYSDHPWYASKSELMPPQKSLAAKPAVYTIGYEGRSVDAFFDYLLQGGIRGIVDVRRNAYSHKYGFSGHNLDEVSKKLGFSYLHVPALGIASELRKGLAIDTTLDQLFTNYERDVTAHVDAIETVARVIRETPTALLCFEADPVACHRGRLAPLVSNITGYQIIHL